MSHFCKFVAGMSIALGVNELMKPLPYVKCRRQINNELKISLTNIGYGPMYVHEMYICDENDRQISYQELEKNYVVSRPITDTSHSVQQWINSEEPIGVLLPRNGDIMNNYQPLYLRIKYDRLSCPFFATTQSFGINQFLYPSNDD